MTLPLMLAALLAASTEPATSAPPPTEAQIERFIAALPDSDRLDQVDRTADPRELERLGALNPDRADAIRPVLEEFAGCTGPVENRLYVHMLRVVARTLGAEKLDRLVTFYEREDIAALDPIINRASSGATLSPAEQAEVERIMAAYPLADFAAEMMSFNPDFFDDALMAEMTRCEQARDASFARLGVRLLSDEDAAAMQALTGEQEPAS
jgi:hypothetical protein